MGRNGLLATIGSRFLRPLRVQSTLGNQLVDFRFNKFLLGCGFTDREFDQLCERFWRLRGLEQGGTDLLQIIAKGWSVLTVMGRFPRRVRVQLLGSDHLLHQLLRGFGMGFDRRGFGGFFQIRDSLRSGRRLKNRRPYSIQVPWLCG